MLKTSILIIIGLQTVSVHAQQTTFFPHNLDDMWEYFVLDGVGNGTLQVRVAHDSTDPSGSIHVRHHRQLLNPTRPPWFPWYNSFRIDSSDILASGLFPPNRLTYRMDAIVGEWWFVDHSGGAGGDIAKVLREYPDTVFGVHTMTKEIGYFFAGETSDTTIWLSQYTELLGEGFGTLFRGGGDLGYNLYLLGCVINGTLYGDTTLVSVDETKTQVPSEFQLYQNYPNPFNPQTTIRFVLPQRSLISVVIHDLLGREVARLVKNQTYPAGAHEVLWDGMNLSGFRASTGVYLLSLHADDSRLTKRISLLR